MIWARFFIQMLPAATAVLRDLHRVTSGDVKLSKTIIRRIRDQGYRLTDERARTDQVLDELDEDDGKGPQA